MEFEFFALMAGVVTGQGKDMVERFLISGKYDDSGHIEFVKSYIGAYDHQVIYTGVISGDPKTSLTISGSHNYGGDFELKISQENKESHVMISYQWNSQAVVKKIAELLKKHGVKIWFDIDGGMQGNINVAMADGVERAKCLVSFHTKYYAKSVNCKKELAYAAALSKPVIPVNLEPGTFDYNASESDEHHWIAKICKECATVDPVCVTSEKQAEGCTEAADLLCELIDKTFSLPAAPEPQESDSSDDVNKMIAHFSGGFVSGWYIEPSNGSKQEMDFEHFALAPGGLVRGQGEDSVGPFVITGQFQVSGDTGQQEITVHFNKQYVGYYSHVVQYDGVLRDGCVIEGAHNYGGDFAIRSDK